VEQECGSIEAAAPGVNQGDARCNDSFADAIDDALAQAIVTAS
jgi:hypothetical protein